MNTLQPGDSHCWGALRLRYCTCTAEIFLGEAIAHTPCAQSR